MEYAVYCDESRHEGGSFHQYMAIGGLWIPKQDLPALVTRFDALRAERRITKEFKWSRLNESALGGFLKVVDLFFDFPTAAFRAIVVDKRKVDLARYHQGDHELGFYKFYYEMLEKWILGGNEYTVVLDYKQNRDPNRYDSLRRFLDLRAHKVQARIADLVAVDSQHEPLVQICDILTGAVAAACCEDLRPNSAKTKLAEHIASRSGFVSLKNSSMSPAFAKFNLFRIRL